MKCRRKGSPASVRADVSTVMSTRSVARTTDPLGHARGTGCAQPSGSVRSGILRRQILTRSSASEHDDPTEEQRESAHRV